MINNDYRLLLFLSVDIVGSTAFKNKDKEDLNNWTEVFTNFYTEFTESFESIYDTRLKHNQKVFDQIECIKKSSIGIETDAKPEIWKLAGDEIIFKIVVDNCLVIPTALVSFIETIKKYRESDFYDKEIDLDLKGCAWIAGFPVINKSFEINGNEDYIGHSIDTGFRLSKFASPIKFILSVDLVYLLIKLNIDEQFLSSLTYHGKESLKGVLNNKPYPIFFIPVIDETYHKDSSFFMPIRIKDVIEKFCVNFIEKETIESQILIKPFIFHNNQLIWGEIPEHIKNAKNDLESYDNSFDRAQLDTSTDLNVENENKETIEKLEENINDLEK